MLHSGISASIDAKMLDHRLQAPSCERGTCWHSSCTVVTTLQMASSHGHAFQHRP